MPFNRQLQQAIGQVGNQMQGFNAAQRHGFQPYCLPDTRTGGVGGTAWIQRLLAAKLPALVGRVPDGNNDFLLFLPSQDAGDVERERIISAAMVAETLAVDENRGLPVDRTEVKQDSPTTPGVRDGKRPPIPEPFVRFERLHHARQCRLNRVGNENGSVISDRRLFIGLRSDHVLPKAIQIVPRLPDHLGTRVLGQRVDG